MTIQIRIVFDDIPALPGRARSGAAQGIANAGNRIVTEAQSRAKVRTGYMRSSTHYEQTGDLSGRAVAPAFYSGFQDLGTRYIAPDHWFSGPAQEEGDRLASDLAALIAGALGG